MGKFRHFSESFRIEGTGRRQLGRNFNRFVILHGIFISNDCQYLRVTLRVFLRVAIK